MNYALKRIDELPSILQGTVKLAGDELGVKSFGLQVLDLPAGFADYPAHDHASDQQEEIYVVLDGSAEFDMDGERIEAGAGTILRVSPEATRKLVPGANGVRVLAIGSSLAGTYERPQDFRVGARA